MRKGSLIPPFGYSPWRDLLDELGKWNWEAPLAKLDPLSIGHGQLFLSTQIALRPDCGAVQQTPTEVAA
jgi:hypothetical protein